MTGQNEDPIDQLTKRLDALAAELRSLRPSISPIWQDTYWYETSVTSTMRALLLPGQTVFDVGANIGAISAIASKLVGPKGRVIAFEASPRVMPELLKNISANCCGNVSVAFGAVSDQAGLSLPFVYGAHAPADHLGSMMQDRLPDAWVPSLTLDGYARSHGLVPDFIKMDIEGAEPAAIRGAHWLLSKKRPVIISELTASTIALKETMTGYGYIGVDLNYAHLLADGSAPDDHILSNCLFYPVERTDVPGRLPRKAELVHAWERGAAEWPFAAADGSVTFSAGFQVSSAGMVVIEYEDCAKTSSVRLHLSGFVQGAQVLLHVAPLGHLATSYRIIPFVAIVPGVFSLVFRMSGEADLAPQVRSVRLYALTS